MDNARRPGLLVGLLVMLLHEPALASSDLRHRIICEIPFQELGPKPRDRVKELIRRDRDFATLRPAAGPTIAGVEHRSTTSTCPATPKISKRTLAPWLPSASSRRFARTWRCCRCRARPSSSGSRPSNTSGTGSVTSTSRSMWPSRTTAAATRSASQGASAAGLHAVWDSCIIEHGLPGAAYMLAQQLLDEVTDQDRATWQGSSPIDWANESFAISVSPGVQYCVGSGTGCWYGADNEHLDQVSPEKAVVVDRSYIETHAPTSEIAWSRPVSGSAVF